MRDLFVYTADSDAQALFRALLERHHALGIRPISFHVERCTGRDSGMVNEGPELARRLVSKSEFSRLLLVWDRDGSGWEKHSAVDAAARIQSRLDGVTWMHRSSPVVLVPELEECIWCCPAAVARHLRMTIAELDRLRRSDRADQRECQLANPKELFEEVVYAKEKRRPLAGDYAAFGRHAKVSDLASSPTFAGMLQTLKAWFQPSGRR